MKIITYLKKVPVFKAILGYALIFFGVVSFLVNFFFPLIFIVIGANLASTEGTQVDFINKRYRTIWSIFGLHIGTWKPCPEFDYISVFRTSESQTVSVVTAITTISREIIMINLFYGNRHLTFYKTNDKAQAFKVAEHFRIVFNLNILDATERDKKWLYEDTLI